MRRRRRRRSGSTAGHGGSRSTRAGRPGLRRGVVRAPSAPKRLRRAATTANGATAAASAAAGGRATRRERPGAPRADGERRATGGDADARGGDRGSDRGKQGAAPSSSRRRGVRPTTIGRTVAHRRVVRRKGEQRREPGGAIQTRDSRRATGALRRSARRSGDASSSESRPSRTTFTSSRGTETPPRRPGRRSRAPSASRAAIDRSQQPPRPLEQRDRSARCMRGRLRPIPRDSSLEARRGAPSSRAQPKSSAARDVSSSRRGWPFGIDVSQTISPSKPVEVGDRLGEVADRDLVAGAEVDRLGAVVALGGEQRARRRSRRRRGTRASASRRPRARPRPARRPSSGSGRGSRARSSGGSCRPGRRGSRAAGRCATAARTARGRPARPRARPSWRRRTARSSPPG